MSEIKLATNQTVAPVANATDASNNSSARKGGRGNSANRGAAAGNRKNTGRREFAQPENEFDQKIIDLARVTRVMAGGKRMRFRACVAIGNKKGKVGLGLAKGADVTLAITKAVNQAKKKMIDVPLSNGTIPHEIKFKFGAGLILLKPGKQGQGIICGGVVRMISELAGINNISGKIMGTNNNVTNAKCAMLALENLKAPKPKRSKTEKTEVIEVAETVEEKIA